MPKQKLCPFLNKPCVEDQCALWDKNFKACSLKACSLRAIADDLKLKMQNDLIEKMRQRQLSGGPWSSLIYPLSSQIYQKEK
jgi:hypothetical protein